MGPRRCTGASGAWLPQVPQAWLGRPSHCLGRASRTLGALVTTVVATSSAGGLAASPARGGVAGSVQRAFMSAGGVVSGGAGGAGWPHARTASTRATAVGVPCSARLASHMAKGLAAAAAVLSRYDNEGGIPSSR